MNLDERTVYELLESGQWTAKDIAEAAGVTSSWVRQIAKEAGWIHPNQRARAELPWKKVSKTHRKANQYEMVLLHLKVVAAGARFVPTERLGRLEGFYATLRNLDSVVEYDPNFPKNVHNKFGGWRYQARRPSDEDLIVRRNHYTHIPSDKEHLFTLPKEKDVQQ